jgi:hypothetical protein
MEKKQEQKNIIEKVYCRPVVCERCKKRKFLLYRRSNDEAQYILKCISCSYCVEFRMVVSWKAEVVKDT